MPRSMIRAARPAGISPGIGKRFAAVIALTT
jgi:hypothetical protein